MMKRCFPVLGTAALVMVLASAGTSRAQMGGFWGGWGTASPWSGTGGWTYWPGGIGINYQPAIYSGGLYYGGLGGGLGYGSMGMYPGYPYGFMASSVAVAPMNIVAYYPPVFTTRAPVVAPAAGLLPASQPATVEVKAPVDAVVMFDGHPTRQTGSFRLFTTPPLVKGKSYHYTVEAAFTQEGKNVTQKQRVAVYAGGRATAVFPVPK
ncbi:MAG TPA: TIGR03000 domain-containing protein [Gemmataceae bacterium]|nr:TIGR03000 domain-containing protein [Gemmataceae bacterium]